MKYDNLSKKELIKLLKERDAEVLELKRKNMSLGSTVNMCSGAAMTTRTPECLFRK